MYEDKVGRRLARLSTCRDSLGLNARSRQLLVGTASIWLSSAARGIFRRVSHTAKAAGRQSSNGVAGSTPTISPVTRAPFEARLFGVAIADRGTSHVSREL
jgi:hypothetical protein